MILLVIFVFGLIVGSFLNAVVFRLHTGESFLFSRSHCPHCNHVLESKDLIPVLSFITLLGKCRYCRKPISWQYPFVELATATSFVLLAQNFQFSIFNFQFWFELVVISFFIIIALYDFKHYLILDKVIFPLLGLVVLRNIFFGGFVEGLIGSFIVAGFFAFQYFISQGRWIGFGDVKLGLVLGSLFAIKGSIVMLVFAYFLGALVGIILIFLGRKQLGSKLPFGVFLSIAAIATLIYGPQIGQWYFKLIGFNY